MNAALYALRKGVAVVICNGSSVQIITKIITGKKFGTLFTNSKSTDVPVEVIAEKSGTQFSRILTFFLCLAKASGRALQSLSNKERGDICRRIAQKLLEKSEDILHANSLDLAEAEKNGGVELGRSL